MNMTKPPKDREFLGLVDGNSTRYWDIFFYGTKEDGLRKPEFVDRGLFSMPDLIRWEELPYIDKY